MIRIEIGRRNSGCTCKGYTLNVDTGHALVVCFAGQMTSGARPYRPRVGAEIGTCTCTCEKSKNEMCTIKFRHFCFSATANMTDLLYMWLTIPETRTAKAQSKPKSRYFGIFHNKFIVNSSVRYLENAPLTSWV